MELAGSLSALRRRAVVAVGVLALVSVARVAYAQDNDPLKFNRDAPLMIVYTVKTDRITDFETGWRTIKDALSRASADAQAFGNSFQVLKVETPAGQNGVYIFRIDMPSKTHSYSPVYMLYNLLQIKEEAINRDEADQMWKMLEGSWTDSGGIVPWPLQPAF